MEHKQSSEAFNFKKFEDAAIDDIYYLRLLSQKGFYFRFQVALRKTWNNVIVAYFGTRCCTANAKLHSCAIEQVYILRPFGGEF